MRQEKTEVIKINPQLIDQEKIESIVACIIKGGVVAIPTETVYGLAVDSTNKDALSRLRSLKKRPSDKPFTLQIGSAASLEALGCEVSVRAHRLISKYWPGALTVIFALRDKALIDVRCRSQEGTLGVRMPNNAIAKAVLQKIKRPLAVPSANVSGEEPAKDAQKVLKRFDGLIDMVVDGEEKSLGIASSVVDVSNECWKILRESAIAREDILNV